MIRPLLNRIFTNKKLVAPTQFVINVVLIYVAWKVFLLVATNENSFLYSTWVAFNDYVAALIVKHAAYLLQTFGGYELVFNKRNIILEGTTGYYVANHCIGIAPCVIFTGFILSYPGKWQNKLWYIPVGVLAIYLINVVRVAMLGVVQQCCNEWFFDLAHAKVYLLMSYGLFFLLVAIWMNKFGEE